MCRRGTVWQEAAVIDLHSLTPATAKVALVTWFRYLRFLAASHGGRNPWPERKTAVIVTGAARAVFCWACVWKLHAASSDM